jgi:hypothetical protein
MVNLYQIELCSPEDKHPPKFSLTAPIPVGEYVILEFPHTASADEQSA